MNFINFEKEIKANFHLELTPITRKKFLIYKDFLQQENKKINLTNLIAEDLIWQKYFFYGVVCYRRINFYKINSILDLGSGSGNPGVILKLLFPHLSVTIVEANRKKIHFMQLLAKKLNLSKIKFINKRIEQIKPSANFSFDLCTARAVAKLEILLELLIPYCKISGLIVIPKSINYKKEVSNLNHQLNILKAKLVKIEQIVDNKNIFNTLFIKKIASTPILYPRKYNLIKKSFWNND